jgi:hypothetical protein
MPAQFENGDPFQCPLLPFHLVKQIKQARRRLSLFQFEALLTQVREIDVWAFVRQHGGRGRLSLMA